MSIIISKYRWEYWFVIFLGLILGLGFVTLCILALLYLDNKTLNDKIFWGVLSIISTTFFIVVVINFIQGYRVIELNENGIIIKYKNTRKSEFYPYNKIQKLSARTIRSRRGNGYEELGIEIDEEESISINAMEFSNYVEMRDFILINKK